MSETILLDRALCLPALDVMALQQGQLIAAIPNIAVQKGWSFFLYPLLDENDITPVNLKYRSHILPLIQTAKMYQQPKAVHLQAWARCEYSKMIYEAEKIEALSSLTIWTKELLKRTLEQKEYLFLTVLRVYQLAEPVELAENDISPEKMGKFIGLPSLDQRFKQPIKSPQILPVLSDKVFSRRKRQIEELKPSSNTNLEELYRIVFNLSVTDSTAQELLKDLATFLDWNNYSEKERKLDPDLSWIEVIAQTGNSSDGDSFEKLVRKSFIKLGFGNNHPKLSGSLDPKGCGGAGGLDFYCNTPYQIVGECKATKTTIVPDGTPAQLVKLGNKHLLTEEYEQCIKIIMAAGQLNSHARQTAVGNKMNVIRPETLQRLVTLKAHHPGAVNLIELKPCLESSPFGEEADTKLNGYIDRIQQDLKIRSHLIKAIKQLADTEPDRQQFEVVEIRVQYNASFSKLNSCNLDNQTVYELLIELSSPLAGYLGRVKASGLNSDRFYFLRDLPIDE